MNTTSEPSGPDLRLVLAVTGLAIAISVGLSLQGSGTKPFFSDTDDAMRMVVVRDVIAGQGWYDHIQHRLNTPWGAEIHWSRLVDLPLAALVLFFTPLVGSATAGIVTGYVWPMLLLAALLWLSARLAFRLVGPQGVLPALILPVLSPAITAEFTPGRIDHHNIIIILTLATAWTAIEALHRPRFAWICGLLAATALALATEALPGVVAAIAVMGLLYVVDPSKVGRTRAFGLAFAAGAVAHLALYRPPTRWLEAACDVLSPVYVLAALLIGVAFTLLSVLPAPAKPWQRFLLLGSSSLAVVAMVLGLYPQCLGGPYAAVDPWLQQNWLSRIVEAKPWHRSLLDLPPYTAAVGAPVFLGTLITLVRLWRVRQARGEWAVLLVFILCTGLVMLAQIRGARLAVMPVIPAAAWLIVTARHAYLRRASLVSGLALLVSWLAFSGVLILLGVSRLVDVLPGHTQTASEVRESRNSCLLPSAFTSLADEPAQRIISPIDLGAHLLLNTPHSVVSAPYHRNEQGVTDTFRFLNLPIAEAQRIVRQRGIDLVVICPFMVEMEGIPSRAPDSFVELEPKGNLPGWLQPITVSGPLKIYRVL